MPERVPPYPSGNVPHTPMCAPSPARPCSFTEGCSPTCQGVLSVSDAFDNHPGVILLEAGWALEIGPAVLQHVVVNLAVLIGHAPHQGHTVIGHQGLGQVDDGGTWHYQGPGRGVSV